MIVLVPLLVAAIGALCGLVCGALTGGALAVLRSYALGAKRRPRAIGLVVSAAPWVIAAWLGDFPVYLLAAAFSGAADGFLAPWVLHGLPSRAPSPYG